MRKSSTGSRRAFRRCEDAASPRAPAAGRRPGRAWPRRARSLPGRAARAARACRGVGAKQVRAPVDRVDRLSVGPLARIARRERRVGGRRGTAMRSTSAGVRVVFMGGRGGYYESPFQPRVPPIPSHQPLIPSHQPPIPAFPPWEWGKESSAFPFHPFRWGKGSGIGGRRGGMRMDQGGARIAAYGSPSLIISATSRALGSPFSSHPTTLARSSSERF